MVRASSMSAAPDHPLARLRPCLLVAIAAQLLMLGASLRHHYVWGESASMPWLLPLLNTGEALAVVLAAALGAFAWWRAMAKAEAEAPSLQRLLWFSLPLLLAAVVVPPFLTADPIDYVVRGRVLAVHGENPYVTVATAFPDDPFLAFGDKAWKGFPLPYGPVLANVQGAVAWLAHLLPLPPRGELIAALLLLKLLFGGALLLAATSLARWVEATAGAAAAARTFVAIAWNPLLLAEGVANAHNDPLLAACLAIAVLAAQRGQFARGTFALGLGVLTKVTPLVAVPLLAVQALGRRQLRGLLLGGLATAALAALFYLQFFRVDGAFDVMRRQGELHGASLAWALHEATGAPLATFVTIGRVFVVLVVGLGMLRLWRERGTPTRSTPNDDALPRTFAAALAALACCGAGLFGVWYHLWWIPLALLGRGTFLARFAVAASCTSLLAYVPWTFARRLDAPAQWANVLAAVLLPLALAFACGRRTERSNAS
jgi:hypothetical protein